MNIREVFFIVWGGRGGRSEGYSLSRRKASGQWEQMAVLMFAQKGPESPSVKVVWRVGNSSMYS